MEPVGTGTEGRSQGRGRRGKGWVVELPTKTLPLDYDRVTEGLRPTHFWFNDRVNKGGKVGVTGAVDRCVLSVCVEGDVPETTTTRSEVLTGTSVQTSPSWVLKNESNLQMLPSNTPG